MMPGKGAKDNPGRPSTYTDEIADAICDAIANGDSLTEACCGVGVDYTVAYKWLNNAGSPDTSYFANKYKFSREVRGEHYGYKVADIGSKAEAGEIDPAAARVAMDAYKWTAGRMAPKGWGDKKELDVTSGGKPFSAESVKGLSPEALEALIAISKTKEDN